MKGLEGLIRLHRWRLDEKRQVLAELERLAARLRQELLDLEREVVDEQKIAAESPQAMVTYGQYAAAVIARRARLNQSLAEIEGRMRAALDAVAQAFRELKKYELVKARRDRTAEEKEKRRQQAVLDELGLTLYRRQEEAR
jgi:flagellar export protein FliJ